MSGGYWEYVDSRFRQEIFDYDVNTAQEAREQNPLDDKEMSELLWDVLGVVHACDYYKSGDSSKAEYLLTIRDFKDKWLHKEDG